MNRARFRYVGPGIIWAMMAVGQTHVVLCTYAGTKFGFDLLWMVFVAHLLVYPVFEYGARYAIATGHSLSHAYLQMRGVRWLIVPFLLLSFTLLTPLLLASMGGVAATVLFAAFPAISFPTWVGVVAAGTVVLVWSGQYSWLERVNVAMAALLLVGVLVAFSLSPPALGTWAAGLVPAAPVGGMITLVALMRLPSDAVTSLLLSAWALQLAEKAGDEDPRETLRGILFGFRIGYALSLIVAVVFLSLGATVLQPLGVDLEGIDLSLQLSLVFTETVGAWTFPLFIAIAFVSLYAGYYSAVQASPLIFSDLLTRLQLASEDSERWIVPTYLLVMVTGGVAIAVGFERPTFLVLLSVSVGLVGLPLYFCLNFFAVTRMIDPAFRPSVSNRLLALAGIVFAFLGVGLFVQTRLFG